MKPRYISNLNIMSYTIGPLVLYFNLLTIWALSNKLCNAIFHIIPPIYFSQVMIILVELSWIEYLERWASAVILSWISSTFGSHKLPWNINTPYPPYSKAITFFLWTFAFNSRKVGSWYFFHSSRLLHLWSIT